MNLSTDIISQFIKATNDTPKKSKESTVYAKVAKVDNVIDNGHPAKKVYVQMDGSDRLTPVLTTTDVKEGERVTVHIKDHVAVITGNMSDGGHSARTEDLSGLQSEVNEKLTNIIANTISTGELIAKDGSFTTLVVNDKLVATEADIGDLQSENASITGRLEAVEGQIKDLDVENLESKFLTTESAVIKDLQAEVAKIEDLDINNLDSKFLTAESAVIKDLQTDVGDINTLMFGSATGDTIHSNFSNAVIAQVGDAQIKSAMIESVSASKITAGDIITNNIKVRSEDGSLIISDETIQISDGTKVRVQIGKDGNDDYSINIWDQNGDLMFSEGGITDSAIKDKIIRDDMVSDTANIAAHKLDIESLFEEINGSTNTIKSTRIYLDDEKQTLDVAFKTMSETVDDLDSTVSSQGTQITAIQGNINSKIWQQDITTAKNELKTETNTLSTQYTELDQKLDGMSATVSSLTSTLDEYSTTAQMNAAIQLKADNITSMVSSSYATKGALADTQADIDNLNIGGRNLFKGHGELEIQLNDYQDVGSFRQFTNCLTFDPVETVGETYTISFWAKSPNGSTPLSIYNQNGMPRYFYFDNKVLTNALGDEWEYFTHTITNRDLGEAYTGTVYNRIEFYAPNQKGVLVKKIKVERGNRATDWTPAPEDMATATDTEKAQTTANNAQETATKADTLVQQLADSISMLVTDGNGTTLMTQTEDGWTFSTADIQTSINSVSETLSDLTTELGDATSAVNVLQQAVADLGEIAEYVKIGTYEDEPCIELGEGDSDFKLLITNTRIMFMEGSNVPAYITNQSLHIQKAVVEEELQQGGFVWKSRSNGNLGLVWKGVNS